VRPQGRSRAACLRRLPHAQAAAAGGLRFLFDCGTFADSELQAITLQAEEIDDYRLVELDEAGELLSGPIRRRVAAALGAEQCVYLEDGRPVDGVEH
jgi:hypothetical protein